VSYASARSRFLFLLYIKVTLAERLTFQLGNLGGQLSDEILLLDEASLRASWIALRLDMRDVVTRPFRKAVDAIQESALLCQGYPSRVTSSAFLSSRSAIKFVCRR